MHSFKLCFFFLFTTFITGSWASPLQKRWDLDHNGIPDLCFTDDNGDTACELPDGAWSTVVTGSISTTSTSTSLASASAVIKALATEVDAVSASTEPTTSAGASQSASATATGSTSASASTEPTASAGTTQSSSAGTSTATSAPISQSATATTSSNATYSTGVLPAPSQFKADNGSKWTIEYVGDISYTDKLQADSLGGDKCRTGKIGDQVIWNCGDMQCAGGWTTCGFSMGPAFYGTDDVMTINTTGVVGVNDNDFLTAWSGDPSPASPFTIWGMDTSNVAPINSTHGVAYAWEIWRGAPDNSIKALGNAVASITLGDDKPIATRVGGLLTGSDSISLGLLAILNADGYIYIYSASGPTNIQIGRVSASDDVFDADKYEFLAAGSNDTWIPGIPSTTDTSVAATSGNPNGGFGCGAYGSVFFNNYLNKYVILCDIDMLYVNFYTSDTPYGPWSAEYQFLSGGMVAGSYGSMAHPEYSVDGSDSDQSFYFSLGPNGVFYMFKVSFEY